MAAPDHTVLARPPNPLGGKSTPSLGRPYGSPDTVGKSRQQVALKLAAIEASAHEIALLVIESEEAHRADTNGEVMRKGCWPLPKVCTEKLVAAIRLLDQYAELLRREP